MPPVSLLIKPASGLCNLCCDYCFYCDEMKNRDPQPRYEMMKPDTIAAVIRKALAYGEGMCRFVFQGGEPTLAGLAFYEHVLLCQKEYNLKGLHIENAIQTNGIGLDGEWAKFLARKHFLAGLSLDGIKKTHNQFRKDANGNGTFDKVTETAGLFDRYNVQYNILTVVNAETSAYAKRIYRFYKRNSFRYIQFIVCLEPLGQLPGHTAYALTPESYGRFLCELFDLWHADLLQGCQPYIRSFENYIGILCGVEPESCDMRGTCGIQYVVESDGSVYPCDFYALDEWRLGNLTNDDFPAIDRKRRELGFMERSVNPHEDCTACRWFSLCRGGCMRYRIGEENRHYFCPAYKQFFEYSAERLQSVADVIKNQR